MFRWYVPYSIICLFILLLIEHARLDSEYFIIVWHSIGVHLVMGFNYRLIGNIIYYGSNKILTIEIKSMVKELGLNIVGKALFWMHPKLILPNKMDTYCANSDWHIK